MFEKLLAFADLLDQKGLKKEADEVDLVVKEAAPIFEDKPSSKTPSGERGPNDRRLDITKPKSGPSSIFDTFQKAPGAWKAEQDAIREKSEKMIASTMRSISEDPIFKTAILGNDFALAKEVIFTSLDSLVEQAREEFKAKSGEKSTSTIFTMPEVGDAPRQIIGAVESIKRTVNKIEEEGAETIVPTAKVAWPEEEIVKLVKMINAGKGPGEVAKELNKTPDEVRQTIEQLKAYEKKSENKGKSVYDFIASQKPRNPACKKLQSYVMSSFMSHSGLGVFTPSRYDEPKGDSSRLDRSREERYREDVDPRVKQREEEIRKKYDASLQALMKLADDLDGKGLKAEADQIDSFIRESNLVKMAGPWDLLAVLNNNATSGVARDAEGKPKANPAVDVSKLTPYQSGRAYLKDLKWVLDEFCSRNDVSKLDEKERNELHQEISEMTGESNWEWPAKGVRASVKVANEGSETYLLRLFEGGERGSRTISQHKTMKEAFVARDAYLKSHPNAKVSVDEV